jgi:hypothetical protein
MVSKIYGLAFCSLLAGSGVSFLSSSEPANATGVSNSAAHHQAVDSREVSSRRKVRAKRHAERAGHHRKVRSAKRSRYVSHHHHIRRYRYARTMRATHGGSVSLAGVVGPLAGKAQQIMATCGSRVVSAVRHGRHSNHASGRAVDLQGNPSCIYSMLRGWPGGVSTDYGSAPGGPHVHVSYSPGGQEWGLRFAHRGGSFSAARRGNARRAYARAYGMRPVARAYGMRPVFQAPQPQPTTVW